MKKIVVTGAQSGLGLSLAEIYKKLGNTVIALCLECTAELSALSVHVHENTDVTDASGLLKIANQYQGEYFDVLINNAGIMVNDDLNNLSLTEVQRQYNVNAIGPLNVTNAFRKNFRAGSKLVNISSRLGSISDNSSGGDIGYRMSKAAQNMLTTNLAIALRGEKVVVVALHPGIVATGMTKGNGSPSLEVAQDLKLVIDDLNLDNTGKFFDRNGAEIPW